MRGKPAIELSDDAHKKAVASLRRYFTNELELEIGDLKAGIVLEYVLAEIGPSIYNQAIADARGFVEERLADLSAVAEHAEFPYWKPAPKR